MADKLIAYLKQLNTSDTSWGLWVNPKNLDEFRRGQVRFENGGILDDWKYVGKLESLSFGHQSEQDALKQTLSWGIEVGSLSLSLEERLVNIKGDYKGKKEVDFDDFATLYFDGDLDPNLQTGLKTEVSDLCSDWAECESRGFVDELERELAL